MDKNSEMLKYKVQVDLEGTGNLIPKSKQAINLYSC